MEAFQPQEIEEKIVFESTPFKISTITALGSIGVSVNLQTFFEKMPLNDPSELGPVYIEYGRTKSEHSFRGAHHKAKKNLRNAAAARNAASNGIDTKVKRFDNQATLDFKMSLDSDYHVNTKMFNNGTVHMTGLKSILDGEKVIAGIIDRLQQLADADAAVADRTREGADESLIVPLDSKMVQGPFSIHLINSDFKVNFRIKREVLHEVLVRNYKNKCTYEPCIYPGVKLQYFYNTATENQKNNGNCQCPTGQCAGKGKGAAVGDCKKVTIGVFQSGCVIITGASTVTQIEECYPYICKVLKDTIDLIRKRNYIVPGPEVAAAMLEAMGSTHRA